MAEDADSGTNQPILLRADADGICTLTLNRPNKRNALSDGLLDALQDALDSIAADKSVRVIILAGNGPVFSSGHDLNEMRAGSGYGQIHALFSKCSRVMAAITRMPQSMIARVHGIATAAGCQLVAACDLAVASSDARFAVPGVTNGLFCSTPAVALGRAVGRKKAMEMLLMGELIDAETALSFGLLNKVVAPDDLDAAVMEYATSINGRSTMTMSMGKAAFYQQMDMELDDAYEFASDVMARNMQEHDAHEGIKAFLEKRPPEWKGR